MAILVFRLRNVPDDEAEEVRQLLTSKAIEFYETSAGNWGISMPALWVNDDLDAPEAKKLIETYQTERAALAREKYLQQRDAGEQRTFIDTLKERPVSSIGVLLFCAAIIYFSTKPFLSLINAGQQ